MSDKLRVFVSSVQKELANERIAVLELISTIDPFLANHCQPVLYEFEPASPDKAIDGCLESVGSCHVFVLIVWREYGLRDGPLSITHREYRHAKKLELPILVYIKGPAELAREQDTVTLLKEIRGDGLKYKRFEDYRQLQSEVRASCSVSSAGSSLRRMRMGSRSRPLRPRRISRLNDSTVCP